MIDTATIKQAAIDSDETGFASVLTNNDTVIALCDEIERLTTIASELQDLCDMQAKRLAEAEKDAARYQWLVAYFVSDRTDQDDAIVAASEVDVAQVTAVIDAAMGAK